MVSPWSYVWNAKLNILNCSSNCFDGMLVNKYYTNIVCDDMIKYSVLIIERNSLMIDVRLVLYIFY